MTLVNIDLRNQGYETGPDDRVVFYSLLVREGEFGTISTAPMEVKLADGKATIDLAPGPVGVQIIAGQVVDTRVKIGEVPPSGPTTLNAVMMVTPAYTPALQAQFMQAIQDAKDRAIVELEQSMNGELGQFRDYATEAIAVATNVDQRVSAIEAIAGLSPESPTDGQTANLVSQPDSLTHAAVRDVAVSAAAESGGRKLDYILARSESRTFTAPAGYSGITNFSASRTPWGTVTTDFDVATMHTPGSGATIYVDPVGGLDITSRTGLSWEDAFKTPGYAKSKNPTMTHLIIRGGLYERTQATTTISVPNFRITGEAGTRVAFACADRLTSWTQAQGAVWSATVANCVGVIDMLGRDFTAGDDPEVYKPKASVSEVAAAPGSFFFESGRVYVHRKNGTQPDSDVMASRTLSAMSYASSLSTPPSAFLENIELWGGTGTNMTPPGSTKAGSVLVAKNAKFRFAGGSGNGLSAWGTEKAYLDGCTADQNYLDGFNYTASGGVAPTALEINCVGTKNGWITGSQNGSTSHNDARVTRVGGRYFDNAGANVADVNNAQSWNIGCSAGGSWDYNQDFYVNGSAQMWLEECTSASVNGFVAADTAQIHLRASYAEGAVTGNVTRM